MPGTSPTFDPDFWDRHFGIRSEQEMFDTLGKYALVLGPPGVKTTPEAFIAFAYNYPDSPAGSYMTAVAITWHAFGGDVVRTRSAANTAAGLYRERVENEVAPLVIPNVYRVAIVARSGGQPVVNVVGVRGSASGQHVGARDAVRAAWKVASGPITRLSVYYTLEKISAMDLSSLNGGISEVADTQAGTAVSTSLATNGACALVKWNGGTRSGASRGRLYFGPLQESDINADGRTISNGTSTALQTAMQNFRNSLEGAGFPLVVISRKFGEAATVTSHTVEATIASQRRRIRD